MRENLPYTKVTGIKKSKKLIVFSLSTCGFCRRAMSFLESNELEYAYCHLDKISLDQKTAIKQELKEQFGSAVAFPFLIIDDTDHLVGFVETEWQQKLGL